MRLHYNYFVSNDNLKYVFMILFLFRENYVRDQIRIRYNTIFR